MRTSATTKKKAATVRSVAKTARVRRGSIQDQDALRGQVRDVAMALFKAHGLAGVTMRAVAAEVGVSAMALYRYFPNKAGLLRGLWEFTITELHGAVQAAVDKAGSNPRARMRASMEAFVAYYEARPDYYRLIFMTEQTYVESLEAQWTDAPIYAEVLRLATDLSRDVALELGADVARARLASDLRYALCLGYLHARLINVRYPWVDLHALRAQTLEQVAVAVENCLLSDGP